MRTGGAARAMSTPPISRFARTGPDPELLPQVDETPEQYLERLRALHARLTALIDAIEGRRPALRPDPAGTDRRSAPVPDRRGGLPDRRVGLPDERPVAIDRRADPPPPGPVDAAPRVTFDRTALVWVVQVAIWIAVVVFALVYGLGR